MSARAGWTMEMDARLRELIEGGMRTTAELRGALKSEFGLDVTKNALVGRINRMGMRLTTRGMSDPERRHNPVTSGSPVPPPARPAPPPPPAAHTEERTSALILQLVPVKVLQHREPTTRTCQYPIGDPRRPDFRFCAAEAEHGPYCLEHAERCYRGGTALDRDKIRKLASVR
ncbi:MAG: GcrA family cell cycle regulator [Pseudomonadota bacterium]|nr:GcrA family cell cycle regulator [Pseudomonadota bacterium]